MCDKCNKDCKTNKVDVLMMGKVITEDVKEILQDKEEVVSIACPAKHCGASMVGRFTDEEIVEVERSGMHVLSDEDSFNNMTISKLIVKKGDHTVMDTDKYHLTCSSKCAMAVAGNLLGMLEERSTGKIRKMTVTVEI